jgi:hypothetical protein
LIHKKSKSKTTTTMSIFVHDNAVSRVHVLGRIVCVARSSDIKSLIVWDAKNTSSLVDASGVPIHTPVDGLKVQRWTGSVAPFAGLDALNLETYATEGDEITYERDAMGRPGIRTTLTCCLGNATPEFCMVGRTIGLVYTYHGNANMGYPLIMGRRYMTPSGGIGNKDGQWVHRLTFAGGTPLIVINAYNGRSNSGTITCGTAPTGQCVVLAVVFFNLDNKTQLAWFSNCIDYPMGPD